MLLDGLAIALMLFALQEFVHSAIAGWHASVEADCRIPRQFVVKCAVFCAYGMMFSVFLHHFNFLH